MILITGGAGYIGAHLAYHLRFLGKKFVVMDWAKDVSNTAKLEEYGIEVVEGDCTEFDDVMTVFEKYKILSVVHMAGYKDVGGSVGNPIGYFYNNVNSLSTVLLAMEVSGVKKIVFSSSCSVYGECEGGDETTPYNPKSPYALSKKICEELIINSGMDYSILRYFNPIGEYYGFKDFSEDSLQNKMKRVPFHIYGNDYNTADGSPVRDFINVDDLARAHVAALHWKNEIVNIGTGQPQSVLSVATRNAIKYEFAPRRPGDIGKIWANVDKWNALKQQYGTGK